MRAVISRVESAHVTVANETVGAIEHGLLVYLGIGKNDSDGDLAYIVSKVAGLRVFDNGDGKLNLSIRDVQGAMLVVSQFTLYGDVRKGRRPSFEDAMPPEHAEKMYTTFIRKTEELGIPVQTGRFRADMRVTSVGAGPITIWLDSERLR